MSGRSSSTLIPARPGRRRFQPVEALQHVHDALAEVERAGERLAQLALAVGRDRDVGDRQLDRVLLEAVEPRPFRGRQELAVDAQMGVALAARPLREVGVVALAVEDERREQADAPAAEVAQDLRRDRVRALRLDRHVAVRAVLGAELHVEQPQEVVDLGQRRDRALAAAAARALLDRHRRRDAEDRVDVGPRRRLHELARVGVQRLEVAPLPLGEHDVERERRLARARHAGDHGEPVARQRDVDVLQVVLARVVDEDVPARALAQRQLERVARRRLACDRRQRDDAQRRLVLPQRSSGVRARFGHDIARGPGADDLPAGLAALGPEVDDPVGGADHVEVVLDDDERVSGGDQPPERPEQLRDVVEVQAGGRLVEEEERPPGVGRGQAPAGSRRSPGWQGACRFGEMPRQLQPLRLAAGERRHRLAEPQVLETDVGERREHGGDVGLAGEERERLGHGQLEHVGDAAALVLDLEHLGAEALAVAVGAAQIDVGEELHLDVLEAVAAAGRAAAVAGVEAEGAGRVAALLRERRVGEALADRVERADVARRIRARRPADRRLVDEHDLVDEIGAAKLAVRARRLGRLALRLPERGVQDVLHQRRLAGAGHAGHADEAVQREGDVDALQVVLGRAAELDPGIPGPGRHGRDAAVGALAARQIVGGERVRALQLVRRAGEHDPPAALARSGPDVEDAVGGEHDLRVVLDDHQRVAGVAQLLHDVDHAAHVARVQADRRLVEHEQRVDERGAERGREVDPLHLAARERARLAVEREVAQADLAEVREAGADLGQEEIGGLVERRGQLEGLEERAQALDRQQHQVVDRALGAPQLPEERVGLEPRAAARRARRVRAVARQQHADVHLVGLGLEPGEEALHAVPLARPGLPPAHPVRVALDHPAAVPLGQVAPRGVERDAALPRHLLEVVLALAIALRLPRLDRAVARALRLVRDHEAVVDADHAPEAAAGLARADRRVEREEARARVGVVDVAVGAVEIAREAPDRGGGCRRPRHARSPARGPPAAPPRSPRSPGRARRSTAGSGPGRPRGRCRSARGCACSPAARAAAGSRPR